MFRTTVVVGSLALISGDAWSRHWEFEPPGPFAMTNASAGGVSPGRATSPAQTSSRIAALPDGGALVIDADSGQLVRTDARGKRVAAIVIGGDAGTLAYDPTGKRAYVADRRGDRIVAVDVGERLAVDRSWKTPAEPYGVALTPDRATLLVTAIADRALVAYDISTGTERWREHVDAEPRGLAIAPDGGHVVVASLTSGAVQTFGLADDHRSERRALPLRVANEHARGAFAVAYLGDHLVATAFEGSVPETSTDNVPDHYGGSIDPPINFELAFLADSGKTGLAITNVNEPRALAWDPAHDALFVAGMSVDRMIRVDHASQVDIKEGGGVQLPSSCGPDGIAFAPDGTVLVWCSFSRTVARVEPTKLFALSGPEIAPTKLDALAHEGMTMFHSATRHVSSFGMMACANCHLDGRADGLSWQIHADKLQTPMLCGRMVGTAPFKWDGTAPTLASSIKQTVTRLGGEGLSTHHVKALVAYLEQMPPVRTPTRAPAAVAHGKRLFESAALGCTGCHDGAMLTDQETHALGHSKQELDTPSLVGLAASAPYFHDGSAPTLEALLHDRGRVHGMAADATTKLTEDELADLQAYLETL